MSAGLPVWLADRLTAEEQRELRACVERQHASLTAIAEEVLTSYAVSFRDQSLRERLAAAIQKPNGDAAMSHADCPEAEPIGDDCAAMAQVKREAMLLASGLPIRDLMCAVDVYAHAVAAKGGVA